MINFRLDSSALIDIIEKNKDSIINQIQSASLQNEKLTLINKQYFNKLWEDIDTTRDNFVILLEKSCLDDISFEKNYNDLKSQIIEVLKCGYNRITLDKNFNIILNNSTYYRNTSEAISDYNNLSHSNFVFFFGHKALDTFVDGQTEHFNTFYCAADLQRYSEKYTIEQLIEVLNEYNTKCIARQDEYSRFFETKANIDKLPRKYNYYVLKNKPEKLMRDHLRSYLNEHMQARFQIEVELPISKKELDLYTEVNGQFYFIEIKWLGYSINDKGTDISTTYADRRAREGVTQTLEYIQELKENTTNNVKCGHLVVFDARETKNNIDYLNFTFLKSELHKYKPYFNIYDQLKLSNSHPC